MNGIISTNAKYVTELSCFQNKLLWKSESFVKHNLTNKQTLTFTAPSLDKSLKNSDNTCSPP